MSCIYWYEDRKNCYGELNVYAHKYMLLVMISNQTGICLVKQRSWIYERKKSNKSWQYIYIYIYGKYWDVTLEHLDLP